MTQDVFDLASRPLTIALPPNPSPTTAFAADQLAYYLACITGQRFAVSQGEGEIRLRVAKLPGTRPGSFCIHAETDALTLTGSDDLALLHSVYRFLENACGCRWLASFEGGETVPRYPRLTVPTGSSTHEPIMEHRAFTNYPDIDQRTVEMVDWMAKNGFNRFMVFSNVEGAFERYQKVLKPHLVLRGMSVEMGHHSFGYWVPPDQHFAAHPEWFAEVSGHRRPDGQLCTSNPEVTDLIARRISEFFSANPEVDMVGLWPNDCYGWCECERCVALEPQRPCALFPPHPARTETYLRFVQAVAEAVAADHPDRRISALAYLNYVEPPPFDLPPNVAVCFAPMHRCFKHPLNAPPECTRNNARYADMLLQWRQRVSGTLYLFCYLMLIDTCSLPYRITRMLGPYFRWLTEVGCDGYVMEFKPEEWGPFGVNAHLIGRLSWEPRLDVDGWLRGYHQALFGPAAEEMDRFFEDYLDRFIEPGPCVYHYDLTYTRRATEELLRPALAHLGRARVLGATGERRHADAVERVHLGIELLLRMGEWQRALLEATTGEAPRRQVWAQRARRLGQDLAAWAWAHGSSNAIYAPRIKALVDATLAEL